MRSFRRKPRRSCTRASSATTASDTGSAAASPKPAAAPTAPYAAVTAAITSGTRRTAFIPAIADTFRATCEGGIAIVRYGRSRWRELLKLLLLLLHSLLQHPYQLYATRALLLQLSTASLHSSRLRRVS